MGNKPQVDAIKTFLKKENNTEGLCFDPLTNKLLLACKDESDIPGEKKQSMISMWPINTLSDKPFLLIHKSDFEKVADEKLEFNPSAIAVHPVTHDIYLLSTRDKCMAIYTPDGKLKDFQFIDKILCHSPKECTFRLMENFIYVQKARTVIPAIYLSF